MEILVFGGTAEGRELVEWLDGLGACEVVSCAATEYGGELVEGLAHVTSLVGPLDPEAKERLVAEHDFACIVDATHPYATHVTSSIAALAAAHGLPLLRLVREDAASGAFTSVADVRAAAEYVASCAGNVLLTTGAKDLPTFVEAMPDFAERLYVRILPVVASIEKAHELGIPTAHVIAMQGPFPLETNVALMRQCGISTMVTKDSGSTGGFQEKVDAAAACGAELVVIARPAEGEGLPFSEVQEKLAEMLGVRWEAELGDALTPDGETAAGGGPESDGERPTGSAPSAGEVAAAGRELEVGDKLAAGSGLQADCAAGSAAAPATRTRLVSLVGIGLGNPDTLTVEAVKAIEDSDLLVGASRMLEPYTERSCKRLALIKSDDIARALREERYTHASVLFSGDVGFYSGATALSAKLGGVGDLEVRAVPGISSVVCLCARLLTPWQDVHLVSAHGRESDPVAEVRAHGKTFMLTGGKTKARDICVMLAEAGLGNVEVHVGERLSYDDERIVGGTAAELAKQEFADLAVMLVENPAAPKLVPGKLEA